MFQSTSTNLQFAMNEQMTICNVATSNCSSPIATISFIDNCALNMFVEGAA